MADTQFAANKIDVACFAKLNIADLKWFCCDGISRTNTPAATARVTKLLKGQYMFFNANNSAVLTDFAAFTAGGTFIQIDLWYIYGNLLAAGYLRL